MSSEASAALEQLRAWKNSDAPLTLFRFGTHDFLSSEESGVRISSLGTSVSKSTGAMWPNVVLERPDSIPRNPAIDFIDAVFWPVETPETVSSDFPLSEADINRFSRFLRVTLSSGTVLLFSEVR